jgi:hypothetical protein
MTNQLVLFDYGTLDQETRIVVQQRTDELKTMFRRTAEDIVEIGKKLDDVRKRLRNGQFDDWLKAEFDMSRRTAYNFVNVYERFGSANFAQLDISVSALYLLAAPGTSDEARAEALTRAEAGESITHAAAKDIVVEHRPPRYCAACSEQIADDVPGRFCAGDHCKYQQTLRPDLQGNMASSIELDEKQEDEPSNESGDWEAEAETAAETETRPPAARVVTVPSAPQPPVTIPPVPREQPQPRPVEAKVVSTGRPEPQVLPPPVMRPISASAPVQGKAAVISIRILPGQDLASRQIMAAIAEEGTFPRAMESGLYADLHGIIYRLCCAFFQPESSPIEGQVLASETIS